jgi:TctA family transporter
VRATGNDLTVFVTRPVSAVVLLAVLVLPFTYLMGIAPALLLMIGVYCPMGIVISVSCRWRSYSRRAWR